MGRVFAARIDHEEDLIGELEDLAACEDISSAFFFMLGAVCTGDVVTGPKKKSLPPEVTRSQFDDAREVLGVGNIFREGGTPKIHIHASAGCGSDLVMGCFRGRSEVFMVMEVVIFEIEGIAAERLKDSGLGFSPVRFFM